MRKILFISNGNSIHTIKWVKAIQKKYKVLLFDWRPINRDIYNNLDNVVIVQPKNYNANKIIFISYLKAFFSINEISKKNSPDLIHAHYATSYGLLGVKAKASCLITSVWGSDITEFPYKSWFHKKLTKYILNSSNHIFVTSNYLAKKVKNICGKDSLITPFGVEVKEKMEINEESPFISFGTAKNITNFSGIDLCLKSFAKLKKMNPNKKITFEIAGDGPFMNRLESIIDELGIKKDVNFYGHIDHKKINSFMNKIDIYINLPAIESFGVAVIEASASRLPVIVSNVGGLPEIVEDGKTGFIVDRENQPQIINAMNLLLNNKKQVAIMGSNGLKLVKEKYNWNDSVKLMISYYKKIYSDTL